MSINAAKLVTMHDDAEMREIIAGCGLVNADGQSVVWASRLLGDPLPERVAGIDLMDRPARPRRASAATASTSSAPAPRCSSTRSSGSASTTRACRSPATATATSATTSRPRSAPQIHGSRADLLFVAMTSPRKEYFLGEYGPSLGVPFVMGVGGSIDVIAGVTRRAPAGWQRLGLEWLYRLLQEPRRMFKRYAVTNTRFAVLVGRALLTRPPAHDTTPRELT